MIYLYIKTHNITGLKYLGKTIQDPYTYKGSGKRWLNHLKKHGNDVTTEIVGQFTTIEELTETSIPLSEKLNIVDSKQWANLRPESGDGGDTSQYIDYSKLNRGKGQSYEQRYGIDKATELKQLRSKKLSETRKGKTYEEIYGEEEGRKLREHRSKQQSKLNEGRTHSNLSKEKIRQKALGRIHLRCSCVVCREEISINNITNHFKKHSQLDPSS
jgi:hypothetical protein